jgi:hypothetical protein
LQPLLTHDGAQVEQLEQPDEQLEQAGAQLEQDDGAYMLQELHGLELTHGAYGL